jgi:cytosine/creatinine deaminase
VKHHNYYMNEAIDEALVGYAEGGIPIGSVLVYKHKIISTGHNQRMQKNSTILHAEMDALENAGRLGYKIYRECTLYTTLSPCIMCTGAILLYQIPEVVIGENINFQGAEWLLKDYNIDVTILQDRRCIDMMSNFIEYNPEVWYEDIGV